MAHLIVTADDFCLTEGVCQGIVRAVAAGVVRDVSVMSRAAGSGELLHAYLPSLKSGRDEALGKLHKGALLGAHLQLTAGTPVLPPRLLPSLVDAHGLFPARPDGLGHPSPSEIMMEWRAQIGWLEKMGVRPAYLDSHHHIHARPEVFPVFAALARELDLPARAVDQAMAARLRGLGVDCPDECLTGFFGDNPSLASLLTVLDDALGRLGPSAVLELMTHPGLATPELAALSSYCAPRELELTALTSPKLPELLRERGIILASMADLPGIFGRTRE